MNDLILSSVLDKNAALNPLDALLLAVIGIVVVFVVLIVLMLIIWLMGKIFDGSEKLKEKHPELNNKLQNAKAKIMFWKKSQPAKQVAPETQETANGTCGELKLINVEERDAAMIMAIVADNMGAPLNELRFISIKKVEDEK
ncbi:MAG: OadG family protein [Clostridia bacterium]|nr:OadG family protein [Clostridia bacterium]